jgi:hypothetical protein
MLQRNCAAPGGHPDPPDTRSNIEFYTIELMRLVDGQLSVGVKATTCEPLPGDDFELVDMQVASECVASLEMALAVIRDAIAIVH